MPQKKIHWTYYTFGFVAALIIGIDCAINAAFYMALMGGFYAVPIVIVFAAIAGLILNAILYANDLPEALSTLEDNIKDGTNSILKNEKISIKKTMFFGAKELIAIASGIVMGLFTYDAYLSMALPLMNPAIIVVFCLAYVIGTYALVRTSLNPEYADNTTIYDKAKNLSTSNMILTFLITVIMILATYWTLMTCIGGAISAAMSISPVLAATMPALFIMLLAGESIFVLKTAIWLGEKFQNRNKNTNGKSNMLRDMLYYIFITLNALANGAIAAASSTKIAAFFGSILSFGVMFKSVHEIDSDNPDIDDSEKEQMNKAMYYSIAITLAATGLWASINFLAPALALAGVSMPLITTIAIFSTVVTAVILFINIFQLQQPMPKIQEGLEDMKNNTAELGQQTTTKVTEQTGCSNTQTNDTDKTTTNIV